MAIITVILISCLISFGYMQLAVVNTNSNKFEPEVTLSDDNKSGNRLSYENLKELYSLSKNISHSKRNTQEADKEFQSNGKREIRRSVLRKATISSDSDVLKRLMSNFNTSSQSEKTNLLDQIEYLVHQYDVAISFAAMNGIETLIPYLFSPNDNIVSSVASVLGTAMQGNAEVKKIAIKKDVGKNLMKLLFHKSPVVISRALFALSSYMRNMPGIQREFMIAKGIEKLSYILLSQSIPTNTKFKIINFLGDLAIELDTTVHLNERNIQDIVELQTLFNEEILKNSICKIIPTFLDLEDFDSHQKTAAAMIALHKVCWEYFKKDSIIRRLNKLLSLYDPILDVSSPFHRSLDKDLKNMVFEELKTLFMKVTGTNDYSSRNSHINKDEL